MLLWVVIMIFVVLQYFIGIYQLYGHDLVDPSDMFFCILNVIVVSLIFIICKLLTPDFNAPDVVKRIKKDGVYSLGEYFNRNRRALASSAILLIILNALNYFVINDVAPITYVRERLGFHLPLIVFLYLSGFRIKAGKYYWRTQNGIALVFLILILAMLIDVMNKASQIQS